MKTFREFRCTGHTRKLRRTTRVVVEGLESRRLLTVAFNNFPLPQNSASPVAITTGSDGNLWFTLDGTTPAIGEINVKTHGVAIFPTNGTASAPDQITSGPDGNLWFTSHQQGDPISEINPTTHVITSIPLPDPSNTAESITSGPDGNIWFGESNLGSNEIQASAIGEINPATHSVTEFTIERDYEYADGITTGPDGNLWFTNSGSFLELPSIGEINPTTHSLSMFPLPDYGGGFPEKIISGSDGNLWYFDSFNNSLGEFNLKNHVITDFPVPNAGGTINSITSGPGGDIWFTERLSNNTSQVGEIDPKTDQINELPVQDNNHTDVGLTSGPDSNLWIAEASTNSSPSQITQVVASSSTSIILPSTTTLSATPSSASVGSPVTVTAIVSLPTGVNVVPSGIVSFMEGQTDLGDVPLNGGVATLTTTNLPVGLDSISAIYGGVAESTQGSRSPAIGVTILPLTSVTPVTPLIPVTPSVNSAVATVAVTSSISAAAVAQPITYSAVVSPVTATAGTPTGAVEFLEGTTVLGVVPLDASGHASLTTIALLAGSQTITAIYAGDTTFAVSIGTMAQTIFSTPAPKVAELQILGARSKTTSLVLSFDEPLNPTTVKKLANYHLADARSHRIALKSATYDPIANTVTLVPSQRLDLRQTFHLRVIGTGPSGVAGSDGLLLDGAGESGTNFATLIDPATLIRPEKGLKTTGSSIMVRITAKS